MVFSMTNAPTPRIGRWYAHVIIKVTRHQSSKHVVVNGRSKSSLYTITVRHPTSHAVIATLHKSDFDFEQLRDRCKAALRHGHKCNALCPWYYVDMTEHVPKRRLFTSPCSRYAVGLHVKIYQDLFDHTLAFLQCPDTQACPIAAQAIPQLFFEYLFGQEILFDLFLEGATSPPSSASFSDTTSDEAYALSSYCGRSSLFPGRRWFEHVSIRVSDAPSKGTISCGRHKSAFYTVTITHKATGATATVLKSDFDFETLRDDTKRILERGHVCQAACPWYYVDVSEHVPKRRLLAVLETSKRAIAAHIRLYQDLFDHTAAFLQCPESSRCPRADALVPILFFAFLTQNLDGTLDPELLVVPPVADGSPSKIMSRHRSYRSESRHLPSTYCGVCSAVLHASPAAAWVDMPSLSKLPCGHVFHDECIVEALNASLECPSCTANNDAMVAEAMSPPALAV
ncbi:hypothetical protein DYB30_004495 [Aphanomyces astaci]|uniref:RING-type domain-containing protein n=1 Tax=Aphanomyces astaci TaxID=112090 RepID=A0A397DBU6_APHAT|nr:hypothetical protein DYB30_004495 [Aphanomyces astaci]